MGMTESLSLLCIASDSNSSLRMSYSVKSCCADKLDSGSESCDGGVALDSPGRLTLGSVMTTLVSLLTVIV